MVGGRGLVGEGGQAATMGWPCHRQDLHPRMERGRLTGRRYRLGKNKEVFDAELYALYQASEILEERGEQGQEYTIRRIPRPRLRGHNPIVLALGSVLRLPSQRCVAVWPAKGIP